MYCQSGTCDGAKTERSGFACSSSTWLHASVEVDEKQAVACSVQALEGNVIVRIVW